MGRGAEVQNGRGRGCTRGSGRDPGCPSWSCRHIGSLTTVSGARTKDGKGFFGATRGRLGRSVGVGGSAFVRIGAYSLQLRSSSVSLLWSLSSWLWAPLCCQSLGAPDFSLQVTLGCSPTPSLAAPLMRATTTAPSVRVNARGCPCPLTAWASTSKAAEWPRGPSRPLPPRPLPLRPHYVPCPIPHREQFRVHRRPGG